MGVIFCIGKALQVISRTSADSDRRSLTELTRVSDICHNYRACSTMHRPRRVPPWSFEATVLAYQFHIDRCWSIWCRHWFLLVKISVLCSVLILTKRSVCVSGRRDSIHQSRNKNELTDAGIKSDSDCLVKDARNDPGLNRKRSVIIIQFKRKRKTFNRKNIMPMSFSQSDR